MMRCVLSLLLALILAFTSQSMAVARGASAATGQMVLCTGAGPVAVYTDAQGQPTSAPHICPDAALNVLLGGVMQAVQVPWALMSPQTRVRPRVVAALALRRPTPPSRAPPLMA